MADHFIQGSFAFTCSIAEAALIEEAWQLAADLMGDFDPAPISDELLAVFPPSLADKPLSGFTTIFDDANFPDFGADIQVENSIEDPKTCSVRSEEHTSELQSLMRSSYAVFCLKKKKTKKKLIHINI